VIKALVVLIVVPGVEVTISSTGVVATEVLIDGTLIEVKVVETVVENVDDDNNVPVRKTDDAETLVVSVIGIVVVI